MSNNDAMIAIIAAPFLAIVIWGLFTVVDTVYSYADERIKELNDQEASKTMNNIKQGWETTKELYELGDNIETVKDLHDALNP